MKRRGGSKEGPADTDSPICLVHGVQHPAPTRSRRKMQERVKDSAQPLPKGTWVVVGGARFDRPIDQERPAHDGVAIDESPVAAVGTLVAIVTHGKVFSRRNDNLVALDVLLN